MHGCYPCKVGNIQLKEQTNVTMTQYCITCAITKSKVKIKEIGLKKETLQLHLTCFLFLNQN